MSDRIEQLRELVGADPDDATTRFMLGRELLKAERHDEAAAELWRAIELDPDYTAARRQLGDALRLAGRDSEAVEAYRDGYDTARRTRDLQTGKECRAYLKRLGVDVPPIE